jgi:hypothetical protein
MTSRTAQRFRRPTTAASPCPILAGDDGNWYVVAEGGAGLPAGTTLRGGVLDVVPLEERTITVSPVSDLAVALADARVAAGKDPDRIAAYHTAVALFDAHWDTDPFDADVKDLTAPSSLDDGAKLTLAIHGLAQLAAQAAVEQGVAAGSLTQLQLLALLRQDVAAPGEVFDGEGGALRLGTCADGLFLCEVGADSLRGYLGGAILAFARTPANGTGLGARRSADLARAPAHQRRAPALRRRRGGALRSAGADGELGRAE